MSLSSFVHSSDEALILQLSTFHCCLLQEVGGGGHTQCPYCIFQQEDCNSSKMMIKRAISFPDFSLSRSSTTAGYDNGDDNYELQARSS